MLCLTSMTESIREELVSKTPAQWGGCHFPEATPSSFSYNIMACRWYRRSANWKGPICSLWFARFFWLPQPEMILVVRWELTQFSMMNIWEWLVQSESEWLVLRLIMSALTKKKKKESFFLSVSGKMLLALLKCLRVISNDSKRAQVTDDVAFCKWISHSLLYPFKNYWM